jgi:hypothetical protein
MAVLEPEQRLAAVAALVLAVSLFLPWWRDPLLRVTYVGVRRLSFIEVAVFLVAVAVLVLLFQRAQSRIFHLPLSDGTLIAASGIWTFVLLLVRVFDPPTRHLAGKTTDYGMRWGLPIAFASSLVLALAGVRARRVRHRGEPEAVAADADATATLPLEATEPTIPRDY